MLKIKSVKFANIGPFVGEHEINLENMASTMQVDAENKNTGGSSGSGKTTLFLALEYLFGINDIPTTILQSRFTKKPLSVFATLEKDGKEYLISRNKAEGLSITSKEATISGCSKLGEEFLDSIIGMPRNLLRPMIHKRQGEGGFFLSMTPKESHAFLMECLNMKSMDTKISKAELIAKESESKLNIFKVSKNEKESFLTSFIQAKSLLVEPKREIDSRAIDLLEEKVKICRDVLKGIEDEKREALSTLKAPIAPTIFNDPKISNKIKEVNDSISEIKSILISLEKEESDRKRAKQQEITLQQSELQKIKSNVIALKSSIVLLPGLRSELKETKTAINQAKAECCPTCRQNIVNGSSAEILERLVTRAKRVYEGIVEGEAAELELPTIEAKISPIEDKIREINFEIIQPNEDIEKTKATLEDKQAEIKKLLVSLEINKQNQLIEHSKTVSEFNKIKDETSASFEEKLSLARNQIFAYEKGLSEIKSKFQLQELNIKNYEQQKKDLDKKISDLTDQLKKVDIEIEEVTEKNTLSKEAIRFLKSYSNQLFQESLSVVAENATKILSRIPNMATATITFDSIRETKSGTIKEEVVAILSLDSEVGIPIKSISGGERAAVDLAVDLAVIEMIESVTGNGVDLFILDEPFDGLDSICRENCLEVLRSHITDKRIMIVDHSNETKQLIPEKIVVVREGQNSRIEC